MGRSRRRSNQALADELMNADLSDLHKLLEDTTAGPITTPSAAKMAESVRALSISAMALRCRERVAGVRDTVMLVQQNRS